VHAARKGSGDRSGRRKSRRSKRKIADLLARVVAVDQEVRLINARAHDGLRQLCTVEQVIGTTLKITEQIKLPALVVNGTTAMVDTWPPRQPNIALQYFEQVSAMLRNQPMPATEADRQREAESMAA